MPLRDPQDLVALVAAEAFDMGELKRVEPELGCVVLLLNVDVRWLVPIGHEEKEPVTANT